jgi:endonuclease/exonuclease/phosphatase family metal-dependent hydrolase
MTHDLTELIRETQPYVVSLQEFSLDDASVVVGREAWHIRSAGEFCLARWYPIVDLEIVPRPDKSYHTVGIRAKVLWTGKTVPVVFIHLMPPRQGLEKIIGLPPRGIRAFRDISAVQPLESALMRRWVEECPWSTVLAGDLNLAVEHLLYRRDWSSFTVAFQQTTWGLGHTMFAKHIWLRIDRILCERDWGPTRCWVVPDVGSTHRPVIADLMEFASLTMKLAMSRCKQCGQTCGYASLLSSKSSVRRAVQCGRSRWGRLVDRIATRQFRCPNRGVLLSTWIDKRGLLMNYPPAKNGWRSRMSPLWYP